jgi:hypothetical protein
MLIVVNRKLPIVHCQLYSLQFELLLSTIGIYLLQAKLLNVLSRDFVFTPDFCRVHLSTPYPILKGVERYMWKVFCGTPPETMYVTVIQSANCLNLNFC